MTQYNGIDYQKTADENIQLLFDHLCIEIVKNDKSLLEWVKSLMFRYIDLQIKELTITDKDRDPLLVLVPTWVNIQKNIDIFFNNL